MGLFDEGKKRDKSYNPVLFDSYYFDKEPGEYDFILVTSFWSKSYFRNFKNYLRNKVVPSIFEESINLKYKVIYPFKKYVPVDKISTKLKSLLEKSVIDFTEYIPLRSKIITMGYGCHAIVRNSDVRPEAFIDEEFNKTYFYHPELKSVVFPCKELVETKNKSGDFIMADTFYTHFFERQLERVLINNYHIKRSRKLQLEEVLDFAEFCKQNADKKEMSLDIETSGFNYMTDKIICIQMSFDGITGYYIPWEIIDVELLSEFVKGKFIIGNHLLFDFRFLIHNGVKNLYMSWDNLKAGHLLNEIRSNSLKAQSWYYTNFGGYERELDEYRAKYPKSKYDEIPKALLKKYATMDSIISFKCYQEMKKQMIEISNRDIYKDKRWNLYKYHNEIIVPLINIFCEIELEGVFVDWSKVKKLSKVIHKEIQKIKAEICRGLGIPIAPSQQFLFEEYFEFKENEFDININSNKQLSKVLEERGWPNLGKSKTNNYIINSSTLTEWYKRGFLIAEKIKELHEVCTIMKTFVGYESNKSGIFQYRYPDNKLHPSFVVCGAEPHRFRHKAPNMANFPKKRKYSREVREFLKPPSEDFVIGSFDGAGFHLRICAGLSKDETMGKVFTDPIIKGDLHSYTGNKVLSRKVPFEEFKKHCKEKGHAYADMRNKAKAINFSIIYNTAGLSFAVQSILPEWSEEDLIDFVKENNLQKSVQVLKTKRYDTLLDFDLEPTDKVFNAWASAIFIKNEFLNTYPKVKQRIENNIKFAEENGYILSPYSAIRRLPELKDKGKENNKKRKKNLYNISVNTDILNCEVFRMAKTMIGLTNFIKENNLKSRIWNMVHDSFEMYLHKDEIITIYNEAKRIFEEPMPEDNGVPMKFEGEVYNWYKGDCWGFGKEIDSLVAKGELEEYVSSTPENTPIDEIFYAVAKKELEGYLRVT